MCFFHLYARKDIISFWLLLAKTDKPDSNHEEKSDKSIQQNKWSSLHKCQCHEGLKKCEYLLDARVVKKGITKAVWILGWILNWKQKEITIRYMTRRNKYFNTDCKLGNSFVSIYILWVWQLYYGNLRSWGKETHNKGLDVNFHILNFL